MRYFFYTQITIGVSLLLPAWADDTEITKAQEELAAVIAQTKSVLTEVETIEKLVEERRAEIDRLEALAELSEEAAAASSEKASKRDSEPLEAEGVGHNTSKQLTDEQKEFVSSTKGEILMLYDGEQLLGSGFLSRIGDKIAVFASPSLFRGKEIISVRRIDGSEIHLGANMSCAKDADLVCLNTEDQDMAFLPIAGPVSLPGIGSTVITMVADPEAGGIRGIAGTVRGIGPDTFELDTDLTPEMQGAPILDPDTGKVIGIVASQMTGAREVWAVGTRHEGTRRFAERTDREIGFMNIEISRFLSERNFLENYIHQTDSCWIAHMFIQIEYRGWHRVDPLYRNASDAAKQTTRAERKRRAEIATFVRKEIAASPEDSLDKTMRNWIDASRNRSTSGVSQNELNRQMAVIYEKMERDLSRKNLDIGKKFSSYNYEPYKEARQWREICIQLLKDEISRLRK